MSIRLVNKNQKGLWDVNARENGSWGHEVERQGDGGEQQRSTLLRNAIPEEEPNASN